LRSIKEISIESKSGDYKLHFINNNKVQIEPDSVVVIDQKILNQGLSLFPTGVRFIPIEVNEQRKSYNECGILIEKLSELKASRSTVIYAIGGGALQDITTFVSAIYMRGIRWNYVPSTLMSMIDSCIGGKSSINFKNSKNLIGNFYPPSEIYIHTKLLETLNSIDFSAGLAEGYKIAFARGKSEFLEFKTLVDKYRSSGEIEYLEEAIEISLLAKKWFIEIDEFDRSERQLLNFGHSYGHALEASTGFSISHGIAVLIGMGAALVRSGIDLQGNELMEVIVKEVSFCKDSIESIRIDKVQFLKSLEKDKKNSDGFLRLILPLDTGNLKVTEFILNEDSLLKCLADLESTLRILEVPYEVF
jgi:3-dehydroquinate synthase